LGGWGGRHRTMGPAAGETVCLLFVYSGAGLAVGGGHGAGSVELMNRAFGRGRWPELEPVFVWTQAGFVSLQQVFGRGEEGNRDRGTHPGR